MDTPLLGSDLLYAWKQDGLLFIKSTDVELMLEPGDRFGGRTYFEWKRIADGPGVVSGDWLDV
jgi:hypothetical protein